MAHRESAYLSFVVLKNRGQVVLIEGIITFLPKGATNMSATLLYHMLGIRGYKFVKQKIVPGGIEFHIECQKLLCPCCGSANPLRFGGSNDGARAPRPPESGLEPFASFLSALWDGRNVLAPNHLPTVEIPSIMVLKILLDFRAKSSWKKNHPSHRASPGRLLSGDFRLRSRSRRSRPDH